MVWDIGTGNGSIAIEWARLAPQSQVFGIDTRQDRLEKAAKNAVRLAGANRIEFAQGKAPQDLPSTWPAPDAIFVGGGLTSQDMLASLWAKLTPGGRLVANAVTLEGKPFCWHSDKPWVVNSRVFPSLRKKRLGRYSAGNPACPSCSMKDINDREHEAIWKACWCRPRAR